ncbi:MAG: WcaF family extracellular polysaccharide biosynthesis acetyltransferase [Cyanobacteria bacterium J06649_4]
MSSVQLANYAPSADYTPGASLLKQLLWYYVGSPLTMAYWLPVSGMKVQILRLFGANIGDGVRIKPGVRVKFPWRLTVADYCWLGEGAWIDNLAPVTLGSNVCLSQGTYLCTGNHDWSKPAFDLRLGAIEIQQSAWVGARSVVGPGVTIGEGAVLTLNSVASRSLEGWQVYAGNPCQPVKKRKISASDN